MVTSVVTGSRVVDPDEGSGHVSYSPGSCCPLKPLLNTLFIGCLIDRMLLGTIHKDSQEQLKTGCILCLSEMNEFTEADVVVSGGLKREGLET